MGSPSSCGRGFVAALFSLAVGAPAEATLLAFDETRDSNGDVVAATSTTDVPDDYGDFVSGPTVAVPGGQFTYSEASEGYTPDVSLEIFGGDATSTDSRVRYWETNYGDLVNIVFGLQGTDTLNIRFTAEPGFEVLLYGFELAGYPSQDWTIAGVEVFAGSTSLYSDPNVLVQGDATGPRHTTFDFATPLVGEELLVVIDYSNLTFSQQDNIAIDNVRFGQSPPPVPEPGTLVLLGAGLAGLARWRRRRVPPPQLRASRRKNQTRPSGGRGPLEYLRAAI